VSSPQVDRCPCGQAADLADCCGRYLAGADAPTAEALMRSRYSAFALGDGDHLARTWHPDTRPRRIHVGEPAWTGLEILDVVDGGMLDATGIVEFVAHHRDHDVHERSAFVRVERRWVYLGAARD
jgi:SEC-C motif-containing protein